MYFASHINEVVCNIIATAAVSGSTDLANALTSIKVSTTLLNSNIVFARSTSEPKSGLVLPVVSTIMVSKFSLDTYTLLVTSMLDSMLVTSTIGTESNLLSTKLSNSSGSTFSNLLSTSEVFSWQTSKMSVPSMSTAAFYTFSSMASTSVVFHSSGKGTDQQLSSDANSLSPTG